MSTSFTDQRQANTYSGALGYGVAQAGFVTATFNHVAPRSAPADVDVSDNSGGVRIGWQFDLPHRGEGGVEFCPIAGLSYFNASTQQVSAKSATTGEIFELGGALGAPWRASNALTLTPSLAVILASTHGTSTDTFDGAATTFSGSSNTGRLTFALGATLDRLTLTPFATHPFATPHGTSSWGLSLSYRFGK